MGTVQVVSIKLKVTARDVVVWEVRDSLVSQKTMISSASVIGTVISVYSVCQGQGVRQSSRSSPPPNALTAIYGE